MEKDKAQYKMFRFRVTPEQTHSETALRLRMIEKFKEIMEYYRMNKGLGLIVVKKNKGDTPKEFEHVKEQVIESGRKKDVVASPKLPLLRIYGFEDLRSFLVQSCVVAEKKAEDEFYHVFYAFNEALAKKVKKFLEENLSKVILNDSNNDKVFWFLNGVEELGSFEIGHGIDIDGSEWAEHFYPLSIHFTRKS